MFGAALFDAVMQHAVTSRKLNIFSFFLLMHSEWSKPSELFTVYMVH
jgi:hypothetical protein